MALCPKIDPLSNEKKKNYMCAGHFFPNTVNTVVIMVQETETKYLQIERLFVDFSTFKTGNAELRLESHPSDVAVVSRLLTLKKIKGKR